MDVFFIAVYGELCLEKKWVLALPPVMSYVFTRKSMGHLNQLWKAVVFSILAQ